MGSVPHGYQQFSLISESSTRPNKMIRESSFRIVHGIRIINWRFLSMDLKMLIIDSQTK